MDAFGVTFLAVITAMGGGIIRDLILGAIPPVAFIKPVYVAAATAVSLAMFFIHRYFKKQSLGKLHNFVFIYMDAVGLGAFTVVGIKKAVIMYGFSHLFLVLTTGFITGIGGGILRDTFPKKCLRTLLRRTRTQTARFLHLSSLCPFRDIARSANEKSIQDSGTPPISLARLLFL